MFTLRKRILVAISTMAAGWFMAAIFPTALGIGGYVLSNPGGNCHQPRDYRRAGWVQSQFLLPSDL